MPRFTNPYPQFTDSVGNPVTSGTLSFFESGTNTLKTVYADSEENTPIANPLTLAADGSAPNVFYSGAARVKLVDGNGVQIFDRDPVGGESQLGNFSTWGPGFLYGLNDIVKAANGRFYISIIANNQDNDPTENTGSNAFWEEIRFVGVYNSEVSYNIGEVAQSADGRIWRSVTNDNIGNNPPTDSGDNWLPSVEISNASETVRGIVELATNSETQIGTDSSRAVTPASLSSRNATESRTGLVELANNAEALAGNDNFKAMTPLRVKESYGQFGLGDSVTSSVLLNAATKSGWYRYSSADPDVPETGGAGALLVVTNSTVAVQQLAFRNYTNKMWLRNLNTGVWSDWQEIYHTGNQDQVGELEYRERLTTASTLEANKQYDLRNSVTYTLPLTTGLAAGVSIKVTKGVSDTPTIQRNAGSSGSIIIGRNSGSNVTDTSITFDINSELVLIWNGSNWEV